MAAYITLKDDLDDLMAGFDDNTAITDNQRAQWRRKGRKAAITQVSFGCNGKSNPNPLRLLEEDGWDGKPVGSLTGRSAQSFFDYNENHVFPPLRDLVRIGIFFGLDIYRTTLLALKGEWEQFFGKTIQNYRPNIGQHLLDLLKDADVHGRRQANNRFNPDTKTLYDELEYHQRLASNAGYTITTFDTLVQHMISEGLHWDRNTGRSIARFAEAEHNRINLLRNGTTAEQEAFWIARMTWQQMQVELDDIHLRIENCRLKNRQTERRWLGVFGTQEIDLQAALFRVLDLERRLLLLRSNPELTLQELEAAVRDEEEEHRRRQNALKSQAVMALVLSRQSGDGSPMSQEQIQNYHTECKRLVRKIYKRIHPDHLENDPDYQALTERQKEELNQLLMACLEPDSDELSIPKGFIQADMRSPEGLQRVLVRIQEILDHAGIDLPAGSAIQGDTLTEQLEWLTSETVRLERDLAEALERLNALAGDATIKRKNDILDLPEQHDSIKAELKQQIDGHTARSTELEAELAGLLRKGV
jgi:hypothetical protein